MSTLIFDTHDFVKRLTEAGMPEAQAEILASGQARLLDDTLATKRDVELVRGDLKLVRAEMREMEQRIIIRLGSMIALSVGLVVALVKLL